MNTQFRVQALGSRLTAFRRGQDKQGRRRSAAIPPNHLSPESVCKMCQNATKCCNMLQNATKWVRSSRVWAPSFRIEILRAARTLMSMRRMRMQVWVRIVRVLHITTSSIMLTWRAEGCFLFGRGNDAVGNHHRAHVFSIRAFRAYPLSEIRQTVPVEQLEASRAIRADSISVSSTLPTFYVCPSPKSFRLLDVCVSSLRRGHANLLCIVASLTDDPRGGLYMYI